jgi:hypothetical protein
MRLSTARTLFGELSNGMLHPPKVASFHTVFHRRSDEPIGGSLGLPTLEHLGAESNDLGYQKAHSLCSNITAHNLTSLTIHALLVKQAYPLLERFRCFNEQHEIPICETENVDSIERFELLGRHGSDDYSVRSALMPLIQETRLSTKYRLNAALLLDSLAQSRARSGIDSSIWLVRVEGYVESKRFMNHKSWTHQDLLT